MSDEKGSEDYSEAQLAGVSADTPEVPQGVLELDHVYEALGDPRRRYLCYTLLEDTRWSLNELANKVAAWERELPVSEITSSHWHPVYVSLYHAHIPKLVEEGVILYDDSTETIVAGDNAEQVLAALQGMGASLDVDQEKHAREGKNDDE